MELAPALEAKRFYHVACREDLPRISREGLLPLQQSGRERNFSENAVDFECVYLWPSVGNAQNHMWEHAQRFQGRERVILQIECPNIYDHLCPDHEDLAWHWIDSHPSEGRAGRFSERVHAEVGDEFPRQGERLTREQSIELVRRLSPDTRLLLANFCALQGNAVMVRASIPVESIVVAELNELKHLQERFIAEQPKNDDGSGYEAANSKPLDEWLLEKLDGGECADVEEMKGRLQEPRALVDNHEIRYYNLRPLAESQR
jgi:hypothetical protein